MAKRARAGEGQLELTGLGEESPSEAVEATPDDAEPAEAGDAAEGAGASDPGRRAPFAMGRMSNRTREVQIARGDDQGPIPGPWKLRAVVRPGPGSRPDSGPASEPRLGMDAEPDPSEGSQG